MLLPSAFFERNPGLVHGNKIGFQPEIGSVSMPSYNGLLRFLSLDEIESGAPCRNSSLSDERAWNYHKFLPWNTLLPNNVSYDHVYAYFSKNECVNVSEWIAAAQIAAHAQYQNLFNGFIAHIFEYTTAVILWKSQSPWPALRGFLYDWYLETTGTLRGIRAALASPVSIVFDQLLWRLRIVNRQVFALSRNGALIGARYSWVDLRGTVVDSGEHFLVHGDIPAMSSLLLGSSSSRLEWPDACTNVCFLRLNVIGDSTATEKHFSWHWLTDPARGIASDFSALGELRHRQEAQNELLLGKCITTGGMIRLDFSIKVLSSSSDLLFYPTVSLFRVRDEMPILPLLYDKETDVVILPGTEQRRTVESPFAIQPNERIRVVLSSWNAAQIRRDVLCSAPEQVLAVSLGLITDVS